MISWTWMKVPLRPALAKVSPARTLSSYRPLSVGGHMASFEANMIEDVVG